MYIKIWKQYLKQRKPLVFSFFLLFHFYSSISLPKLMRFNGGEKMHFTLLKERRSLTMKWGYNGISALKEERRKKYGKDREKIIV